MSAQVRRRLSALSRLAWPITVFPESAIRDGMRILEERDGYPALPECEITLLRSGSARQTMHDTLCNHIVAAIGNVTAQAAE